MNALVLLLAGLLFLMSLALYVYTKKQLALFQISIQSSVNAHQVSSELTAINAGSIGLGERFLKLEKQMQQILVRVDEMSNEMNSQSPYTYAIELVQKGTPAERVSELCHISLPEARLLVAMNIQQVA